MIDAIEIALDVHCEGRGHEAILPGSLNVMSESKAGIDSGGLITSPKLVYFCHVVSACKSDQNSTKEHMTYTQNMLLKFCPI